MRVLEVGPWNCPAEGYLVDPDVEAYVAAELGVWEGNQEGFCSIEVFNKVLKRVQDDADRNGSSYPTVAFYKAPVSAIPDTDFDRIIAANVFGDPLAVPKNPDGTLKPPIDQTSIMARSLARKIAGGGVLEIVEGYTPIPHEVLFDLLGKAGFELDELLVGQDDFADSLKRLYPYNYRKKLRSMDFVTRLISAQNYGIEGGVTDPYIATFRLA